MSPNLPAASTTHQRSLIIHLGRDSSQRTVGRDGPATGWHTASLCPTYDQYASCFCWANVPLAIAGVEFTSRTYHCSVLQFSIRFTPATSFPISRLLPRDPDSDESFSCVR
jgi:hypothetical protein